MAKYTDERFPYQANFSKKQNEDDLRHLFETFGVIQECSIHQDKNDSSYAFVKFSTQEEAQLAIDTLHCKYTMPGESFNIVVTFAHTKRRADTHKRRLFIGMLNKYQKELEVRRLFEPFGTIQECRVIQDQYGNSKCCAFVKFSTHNEAQSAIKALHAKSTMPGVNSSILVEFAETKSEKQIRKRTLFIGMLNMYQDELKVRRLFEPFGTIQECQIFRKPSGHSKCCAFLKFSTRKEAKLAINALHGKMAMPGATSSLVVRIFNSQIDRVTQNIQQHNAPIAMPYPYNAPSQFQSKLCPQFAILQVLTTANPMVAGSSALNTICTTLPHHVLSKPSQHIEGTKDLIPSEHEGCNLYINYLPKTYDALQLAKLFMPFGTVISVHVYVDKTTNERKGFGFVMFDNPNSAHAAIQMMHGYRIDGKRLKVELKRPRCEAAF